MTPVFPFSAVVDNEDLKLALLLAALDPKIAGVLIEGEKGTAKTTLARALGSLLPAPGKFVELPLGATEDRVKGAVDLAHLVKEKAAVLRQGLLGEANGGVLYVDEVNLLADHIVDMVLDAAATGENRIERDSISVSEPSNFVLIGSMNSEEGWLRPQLLDRFGLYVTARAIADTAVRIEATKRRLAFDADPESFCEGYAESEAAIAAKIAEARQVKVASQSGLLAEMTTASWDAVAGKIDEMHSGSLRADLVLVRAACAYAFWRGDAAVTPEHVAAVAPLVFAHRSKGREEPPSNPGSNAPPPERSPSNRPSKASSDSAPASGQSAPNSTAPASTAEAPQRDYDPETFASASGSSRFEDLLRAPGLTRVDRLDHVVPSRRGNPGVTNLSSGASIRPEHAELGAQGSIDALATLRRTVTRTHLVGDEIDGEVLEVRFEDFYRSLRYQYQAKLVVVALDTSGSMGVERRIALAREVLVGVLDDSYKRRNRVTLVTFSGTVAKLVVSNARSVELLSRKLSQLSSGGMSPLGAGLTTALAAALAAKESGMRPEIVVISDGRATSPQGDAIADANAAALAIGRSGVDATFIDLEIEHPRLNYCERLSQSARGRVVRVAS